MTSCIPIKRHTGFTFIEMLVVVAIVGIAAAIAIPNYSAYVTQANRTDAMKFLTEIAGEQQKYFSEYNVYASTLSDLGYSTTANPSTTTSPESHYTVSVDTATTGLSYEITATPVSGGRQANDAECKVFTIDSTGAKGNSGGTNSNCW